MTMIRIVMMDMLSSGLMNQSARQSPAGLSVKLPDPAEAKEKPRRGGAFREKGRFASAV
jgi:hypothetical protein